ncbi:MAG: hypothetical protein WC838_06600 [Candidatus Margulisiibacteriota bacterium]|jgi:antitoxin component YwqK of YwqJK toxin-antitoxin module
MKLRVNFLGVLVIAVLVCSCSLYADDPNNNDNNAQPGDSGSSGGMIKVIDSPRPGMSAEDHYKQAYYYYVSDQYQLALREYTAAAELDDSEPKYLLWMARCYCRLGDIPSAIPKVMKVISIDPGNKDADTVLNDEIGSFTITGTSLFRNGAKFAELNGSGNIKSQPGRAEIMGLGVEKTDLHYFLIPFKKNKREGTEQIFTTEGILFAETSYKNGEKNGPSRLYANGDLFVEQNYLKNRQNGPAKCYSDAGPAGHDGLFREYFPDGKIKHEIYVDKGDILEKVYYSDGLLQLVVNYKNNRANGLTKIYYEDGAIREEQNYKDDRREGITKIYNDLDKGGKLAFQDTYAQGIKVSRIAYGENGEELERINY